MVVLLAVLTLGGCSSDDANRAEPQVPLPTRLAPTQVAGLVVREESKAAEAYLQGAKDRDVIVSDGTVVSFNRQGLVQAALQVAQLKQGYVSDDPDVVSAITRSVGNVTKLKPQGDLALYSLVDGSQRIYLWFPTVKSMALLVVRTAIPQGAAEALARGLVDYGQGGELNQRALEAAFAATEPAPSPTPSPAPEATP
jgi:hypothetical protein